MSGDSDGRMRGGNDSVDPVRMEVLIEAMTPPVPQHLRLLEQEALAGEIPVIRPQTQGLLRFFIAMKRPDSILEIGTAVGFSALFMRHYSSAGCRIVTIERDPARAEAARRNFAKFDAGIELLEGDAAQILSQMDTGKGYDLIFMDAAKGQYIRFLPDAVRLLAPGGLLITDNILQEGEILSSRYIVTRRNRTIHHRMREYIRALMEEPSLETLLLSNGDGTAVSVKSVKADGNSGNTPADPETAKPGSADP